MCFKRRKRNEIQFPISFESTTHNNRNGNCFALQFGGQNFAGTNE